MIETIKILKKIIHSNLTALIFSVGAVGIALWHNEISIYFVVSYIAIILIYLLLATIYRLIDRWQKINWIDRNTEKPIYQNIEHEWRISETGDCIMRSVYEVTNIGNTPVKTIPFDNFGWFVEPDKIKFNYSVVDKKSERKMTDSRSSIYKMGLSFFSKRIRMISWSSVIDPPLLKKESFLYEIRIDTSETEKDAFSDNGTYVGIPANLPVQKANLKFIAPGGYKFIIMTPKIVLDNAGVVNRTEIARIANPELSASQGIISWNINNLILGNRYILKYRLVKE